MFNFLKFAALAIASLCSANLMAQYDQDQLEKTIGNNHQFVMGINAQAINQLKEIKKLDSQMCNEDALLKKLSDIAKKEGFTEKSIKYAYFAGGEDIEPSFVSRVQTDLKAQQVANIINAIAKEIESSQSLNGKLPFSAEKVGNHFVINVDNEMMPTENKTKNEQLIFKEDGKGYLSFTAGTHKPITKNKKEPLVKLIPKNAKDLLLWGIYKNEAFIPTLDTVKYDVESLIYASIKTVVFSLESEKDNFVLKITANTRNAQVAKTLKDQVDGQMMMIDIMLMKEPVFAALVKKAINIKTEGEKIQATLTFTPELIEAFSAFINKAKEEAERSQDFGNFELDDLDVSIDIEDNSDSK